MNAKLLGYCVETLTCMFTELGLSVENMAEVLDKGAMKVIEEQYARDVYVSPMRLAHSLARREYTSFKITGFGERTIPAEAKVVVDEYVTHMLMILAEVSGLPTEKWLNLLFRTQEFNLNYYGVTKIRGSAKSLLMSVLHGAFFMTEEDCVPGGALHTLLSEGDIPTYPLLPECVERTSKRVVFLPQSVIDALPILTKLGESNQYITETAVSWKLSDKTLTIWLLTPPLDTNGKKYCELDKESMEKTLDILFQTTTTGVVFCETSEDTIETPELLRNVGACVIWRRKGNTAQQG